jgi:aspartate kinase
LRVPDRPGIAARLFGEIARQQVDVDLIIQSIHEGNSNDIAFTVVTQMLAKAEAVAEAIAPVLRHEPSAEDEAEVMVERRVAKIAIAGAGMIGRPGIAAKMFSTLAEAGINIEMISTSEVKVSCVIDDADGDRAIAALCRAFDIAETRIPAIAQHEETFPPVRGVALDNNQAQIAIRNVPDRPGMAARIFTLLAEHNISVGIIIQSQRCRIISGEPTRDIAFTAALSDAETARQILTTFARENDCGEVSVVENIAKVSIVGAGMLGQPGVAARFFDALAREQINIQMIATSEIKISCVVAQSDGSKALKAIHHAFNLAGREQIIVPA